jgi:hypothetical protein
MKRNRMSELTSATFIWGFVIALSVITTLVLYLDFEAPRPSLVAGDDVVHRAVNRLPTGSLTFNAPSEMRVGETRDMEAVVSRKAHDKIAQALRGGGIATTVRLKVAPTMAAQLLASDREFHITALQPDVPLVFGPDGKIHWFWRIEPLKSGRNLEMQLILQAVFEAGGRNDTKRLNAITRAVVIRVNAQNPWDQGIGFFKDNWQWLWTALLVPLAGWAWTDRRKKPKPNKSKRKRL